MVGEWIELEFPPMMVGGELWSKVVGAWGAAPVDGLSAMPLSRPFGRVSTLTLLNASWRWSSGGHGEDGELAMLVRQAAGEIALWRIRDAEGPRGLFVIFLFLRDLSAKQLSSVSFLNISVFVRIHVLYP